MNNKILKYRSFGLRRTATITHHNSALTWCNLFQINTKPNQIQVKMLSGKVSQESTPLTGAKVDAKSSPIFIGQTKFTPLPDAKNIMVTGGAGFIASYVVRHFTLQYPEYNVISYDKLDYCATTNNTLSLEDCPNFTFEKGDITGKLI